jgi:hypothetical protein
MMLSWHARVMVAAWGVLVPLGILIARYFKIPSRDAYPRQLDSPFWWNTHRTCQYTACVLMVIGLSLILNAPRPVTLPGPHWWLGWSVLSLALLQLVGGLLRGSKGGPTSKQMRGDHYDMTKRRLVFEYVHKSAGYVALVMAVATIVSGLWQANAPNWMLVVLCGWWASLGSTAIVLQKRGMAWDTYQAIWGPDPKLPGNRRKPIGLGVKRWKNRT